MKELHERVIVLLNHLEDVLPDDAFDLIDHKLWNSVSCYKLEFPEKFTPNSLEEIQL